MRICVSGISAHVANLNHEFEPANSNPFDRHISYRNPRFTVSLRVAIQLSARNLHMQTSYEDGH
jgi:hypothetical protein